MNIYQLLFKTSYSLQLLWLNWIKVKLLSALLEREEKRFFLSKRWTSFTFCFSFLNTCLFLSNASFFSTSNTQTYKFFCFAQRSSRVRLHWLYSRGIAAVVSNNLWFTYFEKKKFIGFNNICSKSFLIYSHSLFTKTYLNKSGQ